MKIPKHKVSSLVIYVIAWTCPAGLAKSIRSCLTLNKTKLGFQIINLDYCLRKQGFFHISEGFLHLAIAPTDQGQDIQFDSKQEDKGLNDNHTAEDDIQYMYTVNKEEVPSSSLWQIALEPLGRVAVSTYAQA